MAYILAVNPQILSPTGTDFGAFVTATALTTAVFALLTNWPIAIDPLFDSGRELSISKGASCGA